MKDDRVYLLHIMKCISRVEEDTVGGREEFFESAKTRDSVIRNLQILAESSQRISPELKARHPDVDWKNMKGFRNIHTGRNGIMLCNKFIAKNIGAESDFRWRSHEITRIEGFSDAVFAFAVTLLTPLIFLCFGSSQAVSS